MLKRVREIKDVMAEMRANNEWARLGLTEPNEADVEAFVRRVEEVDAEFEARLPKPWDEMTQEEQDTWLVQEEGAIMLTPAEARARYGDATIIFFGSSQPAMRRGSIVRVQEANGAWRNQMVAVAAADGLIHVADEAEWQAAQAEGREPQTTAYPEERVALAEGE